MLTCSEIAYNHMLYLAYGAQSLTVEAKTWWWFNCVGMV